MDGGKGPGGLLRTVLGPEDPGRGDGNDDGAIGIEDSDEEDGNMESDSDGE